MQIVLLPINIVTYAHRTAVSRVFWVKMDWFGSAEVLAMLKIFPHLINTVHGGPFTLVEEGLAASGINGH